ncbi:MAG: protein kinase [Planctomycetes bacterium]|nr:protein kinase [Planctomycetota bacterium]
MDTQPTPDGDLRRIRALFDEVVDLPAEQRRAHLERLGVTDEAVLASVLDLCHANDMAVSNRLVAGVHGALRAAADAAGWPEGVGGYELVQRLGAGGMGEVFLAHDARLGRKVAVKVMAPHLRVHAAAVARFEHEARAAAALSHPGIGRVHEVGVGADGSPWFSMEFVPGTTLAAAIARRREHGGSLRAALHLDEGALPECGDDLRLAAALAAAVARALAHAHERGVVHRDVKPQNLVVRPDGQPVLLDFGLARFDVALGLSRPDDFLGTPSYASPEQVSRRGLAIDHRTDVYSLGATLYEAIAGRPPFLGESQPQLLRAIETQSAAPLHTHVPGVPRDFEAIVAVALAKEPQHRYATAAQFADDLERFVAGRPVQARPLRPWVRWYRWSARHPAPVAAVLSAGLALVAVLVAAALAEAWSRTGEALAATEYATARLLLAKGDHAGALVTMAAARQHGFPDPAALQLVAFEAHEGRGAFAEAGAVLAAIVATPAEPALAARLQLLRGDFGHDRIVDPERGLDQVASALATGQLEAVDASYAACLLADDLETASAHARRALEVAPAHRRAGLAAFWLALARGDRAEVLRRHEDFRRRFPGDAQLPVLARGASLLSRAAATQRTVEVVEAALRKADDAAATAALFDGLELLQDMATDFAAFQQGVIRGEEGVASVRLLWAWLGFDARGKRIGQALQAAARANVPSGAHVHPLLVRAWRPLVVDGLLDVLVGLRRSEQRGKLLPHLDQAAGVVGDGFFELLRGYSLGLGKDYVATCAALQRAIEQPSLMGLQRHALRIQVTLQAGFACGKLQGLPRTDLLPDLEANVLRMLAYADLATEEWDQLASTTMLAESFELANRVVADWRRLAPGELLAVKAEMDLAYRRKEWERALRCAEEALAMDAKLPWANFVKEELAKWLRR